ncbi:MAG: hypothetical protein HZB71_03285 [Betaproteobacteria bacterium]|nr:hypothetical protein [Betaproteobacteria bacterium]
MTSSKFDLAVLGADDPLGEALLRALEEKEIPIGRLRPLTLGEETESGTTWQGSDWPCEGLAGFDPAQVQAVVCANASATAARQTKLWREARPHMPQVGPEDITPAPAVAVARVLKALVAVAGPVRADAFCTLPASLAGKAGIDELANQSKALFNLETPESECFPLQLAFNLLPQGQCLTDAYLERCVQACQAEAKDAEVQFSAVWSPVFYGASVMLHARAGKPVDAEALREALRHRDDVTLMESELAAGLPTPATDAADSDDVFVGQIAASGNGVRLWLVFDPLRLEAAQLAAAVENWIDIPSDSVLT